MKSGLPHDRRRLLPLFAGLLVVQVATSVLPSLAAPTAQKSASPTTQPQRQLRVVYDS